MIYLDYQATTPCDPRVVDAMSPYWTEQFGNPASRSHRFGRSAKGAVEDARQHVARLINASPKEVIWTSGATEANNLALFGLLQDTETSRPHMVSVRTEHASILDPFEKLERMGVEVQSLEVDANGRIDLDELQSTLTDRTRLVSVMSANNEVGVIQDLAAIGAICRDAGIPFHTDAAQACGKIPLDVRAMNIDLMSMSAHKLYGPKGVGALFVRRGRPRLRLNRKSLAVGMSVACDPER